MAGIKNGELIDATELVEMSGRLSSQNINRILKSNTSLFINEQYSGADDFTDSNGIMDTVDTANSTAIYESDLDFYSIGGDTFISTGTTDRDAAWTDEANAFDLDDGTYAQRTQSGSGTLTTYLGKTFSSTFVGMVRAKSYGNVASPDSDHVLSVTIYVEKYNGATWDIVKTFSESDGSGRNLTLNVDEDVYLNDTVEGVRIRTVTVIGSGTGSETHTQRIFNISYAEEYNSSDTVETDLIISDIIPNSIVVYGENEIPANTDITIDVSDDGGSTFSITGQSFDSYIDTSSFSGSDLALKFNLNTSDVNATPKLYGYGVVITDA